MSWLRDTFAVHHLIGRGIGSLPATLVLLFVCTFLSACKDLVKSEVIEDKKFTFQGLRSLNARPDDGTWILRWDAVPQADASYEIFSREVKIVSSGSPNDSDKQPYNFETPIAVSQKDFHITENLLSQKGALAKKNTCFVVRLRFAGYTDTNENELCTNHTIAVSTVIKSISPVFTSLSYSNVALDKLLSSSERNLDSEIVSLKASHFGTAKYTFVAATAALNDCASLPGDSYTEGTPKANDPRLARDDGYKICVELATEFDNKVYGISADILTVDTAAPEITSLILENQASDGLLNASEAAGIESVVNSAGTGMASQSYAVVDSAVVSCDSVQSFPYSAATAAIVGASNGAKKVCMRAADAAGNVSYAISPVIVVDKSGPSMSVSSAGLSSLSSLRPLNFTIVYSDAGSGLSAGLVSLDESDISLSGDTVGCSKSLVSNGLSHTVTLSGCSATSGAITVNVAAGTATDNAGNAASGGSIVSFSVDNLQPVLSITSPTTNALTRENFSVQGTCENGLSVVASVVDGGSTRAATCVAGIFSIPLSLSGTDGNRTVVVSTTDGANFEVIRIVSIRKDSAPPAATISAPTIGNSRGALNYSNFLTYSLSFSDTNGVASLNTDLISVVMSSGVNDCSKTVTGSGTSASPYVVRISNCSGNGTVGIKTSFGAAVDSAGNSSLETNSGTSVTVDNLIPAPLAVTSPAAGTVVVNEYYPPTLEGDCETGVNVSISRNSTIQHTVNCVGGRFSLSTWTFLSGYSYTIHQTDAAGNIATAPISMSVQYVGLSTPSLYSASVPFSGLSVNLSGSCDRYATSHSATTSVGFVRSVSCTGTGTPGTMNVVIHLPAMNLSAGVASFTGTSSFVVQASSSNSSGVRIYSSPQTFTRRPFICPTGYVGVPASIIAGLGNTTASATNTSWWLNSGRDFCVMKYPAKNVASAAESVEAGVPWLANPNDATNACAAVGSVNAHLGSNNFRLISNTQWQTVARNLESVVSNWSGGAVGSGVLSRGHTDNSPNASQANNSDDKPYAGTDNDDPVGSGQRADAWNTLGNAPAAGAEQRRVHTLSNGEVVWDFAGNIWQWVSDTTSSLGLSPSITTALVDYSNSTSFPTSGSNANTNRLLFAPLGSYVSSQNIGRMAGGAGGFVRRGGYYNSGVNAGIFAASLAADDATDTGFRCAYLPYLQPPTAPTLTAANVTGLRATISGTCDSTNSISHSFTTTVGRVISHSCTSGTLSVVVHLPAGSANFNVTATSTNPSGSSSTASATFTRTAFTCPTGYVGVPGSGTAGLGNAGASNTHADWWLNTSRDFCLMKYPAKNNSYAPASVSGGTPWVNISRDDSAQECAQLGANYRLISNTQWQTIARNLESVALNWSGGNVGSGKMARGHSDGIPNSALAHPANDTDSYFGTENTAAAWNTLGVSPASGSEQKRTQTLSNGEVVWDISGNVAQWISDDSSALGVNPTLPSENIEFSNTSYFPLLGTNGGINRLLFGPLGSFTTDQNVGGSGGAGASGVLARGGRWSNSRSGLFEVDHAFGSSDAASEVGFRCVYVP